LEARGKDLCLRLDDGSLTNPGVSLAGADISIEGQFLRSQFFSEIDIVLSVLYGESQARSARLLPNLKSETRYTTWFLEVRL
jgi:hypothetical protein